MKLASETRIGGSCTIRTPRGMRPPIGMPPVTMWTSHPASARASALPVGATDPPRRRGMRAAAPRWPSRRCRIRSARFPAPAHGRRAGGTGGPDRARRRLRPRHPPRRTRPCRGHRGRRGRRRGPARASRCRWSRGLALPTRVSPRLRRSRNRSPCRSSQSVGLWRRAQFTPGQGPVIAGSADGSPRRCLSTRRGSRARPGGGGSLALAL